MHTIGVGGGKDGRVGVHGRLGGAGLRPVRDWAPEINVSPPPSHSLCITDLCSCVAECHDEAIRTQVQHSARVQCGGGPCILTKAPVPQLHTLAVVRVAKSGCTRTRIT
jgi:hypothetical protein